MKKTTLLLLLLFLLACLMLTACDDAVISDSQVQSDAQTSESEEPEEKDLDLTVKSLPLSGDSEGLPELYDEIWELLSKYDTIKGRNEFATNRYYALHRESLENQVEFVDGVVIVIDLAADRENQDVRYMAFLTVLLNQCSDSVCYSDYMWRLSFSRSISPTLFYSEEYQSKGYENAYEYRVAIREGKCDSPQEAYKIYFDKMLITKYGDTSRTNLLEISEG